jgi:PAS domain S-box-containing protein
VTGVTAFGEDAVALAEKEPPDLICMDIGLMGKIDGIETARRIHEHADTPVIYLTSHSDSLHLARAKETGPYSYIVKPFSDRELLVSIEMALHRHRIDRQLRESMERYRAIVDNASESILLVSTTTTEILEANPAFTRLTGYSVGELSGMSAGALITLPGEGTGPVADLLRDPDGWSGEVGVRCRDGSLRDAELTSRVIHRNGMAAFSSIIAHDITERKRAEMALREAHRKLNLLSSITRHDILNQLAILYGFLELSRPEVAGTRLEKYVEKEMMAAEAIRRMISFTRDYEEIGKQQPGWHRPDGIIRQLARTASPPGMVIDSRLGELELYADPLLERV